MARWKLSRLMFGNEEFTFNEGDEVTVGRGINNKIPIPSIVVSRNHCVINFKSDKVLITDLKSSNGIYVGLKKIPPNTPYTLKDSDIIGIGWTSGAPILDIDDDQHKYMFKLNRQAQSPLKSRIKYQTDNEDYGVIETKLQALNESNFKSSTNSPIIKQCSQPTKRKIAETLNNIKVKEEDNEKNNNIQVDKDVVNLVSDSENEEFPGQGTPSKKPKLQLVFEDLPIIKEEPIKTEKDDDYDPFKVKQEYCGYDDEPIQIDSDSDDGESVQWLMRLSQSSPGKPLTKIRDTKIEHEESSYSQIDDFDENNEEELMNDLITIPPQPCESWNNKNESTDNIPKIVPGDNVDESEEDLLNDLISLDYNRAPASVATETNIDTHDVVDSNAKLRKDIEDCLSSTLEPQHVKKAQMIEALVQMPRSKLSGVTVKHKSSSHKHTKEKKNRTNSKKHINETLKEERKKKLKEIASKEKEENYHKSKSESNASRVLVSAKVTSANRGAFLTDVVEDTLQTTKKRVSPRKPTSSKEKNDTISPKEVSKNKDLGALDEIENRKKQSEKSAIENKSSKGIDKKVSNSSKSVHKKSRKASSNTSRVPLKSLKPLSESEESFSGKPFSKVEPLPPKKPKKIVRFSDAPPAVHVFEIEEGNKLNKTSLARTSLVDIRQTPMFSLEKITLMRILRWNPHWLEEQKNNNEPPPILGHNNPAMAMFHSFNDHKQYVQQVGDLLLMEIWECLTQGFIGTNCRTPGIQMRIASLPPVPTQDRCFELFNLSVNISMPNSEIRTVPRMGEVLLVVFGPENAKSQRFFYVHNVRCLPSPPNNIHSFFCISLHTCYTDKMKTLRPGELMVGISRAYIQKELLLFAAMEHLAGSPLSEAILKPEPRHFVKCEFNPTKYPLGPWTKTLNPSQQVAVHSSVSAALADRPCIQMVQGPPGTGKSSVICAIVMSYFYDSQSRRQQNRGKILICATSNAAVDELVCRLLNIRQNLPKAGRFRMVRVGRAEAMHPRAHDISSQQLAQRDAAARLALDAAPAPPAPPGLAEEISHLEAKINMWKTQEQDAKDPMRAAYCKSRITQLANRIGLLRGGSGTGGGGGEVRAEHVAAAERRIIEGADIIVTTLASAHNHKMQGLKRRIALCIVDEAGQAIEPETLIPLTLDVTKLTLIGDPQQLPGFICSQRAKKHGLGESLFSRLSSCAEHWPEGSPIVLLNQQYRMQADIADYPNRAFYGGRIATFAPTRPKLDIPPYCIISISSGDKGQGSSGANEMEAWGVSRLVLALNTTLRAQNLSLAVITPYNAHKELLKRNIRQLQDPSEGTVEVNTVDSFQGQERDVVVVSLARSQGVGFLTDAGRMNVMLTRARHALVVCLNPHATLKNQQWRTLVEDAQKRNLYRILPNKVCQGTSAGQIPHADLLKYVTYQKPNCK